MFFYLLYFLLILITYFYLFSTYRVVGFGLKMNKILQKHIYLLKVISGTQERSCPQINLLLYWDCFTAIFLAILPNHVSLLGLA